MIRRCLRNTALILAVSLGPCTELLAATEIGSETKSCSDLIAADFSTIPDAPAQILSAVYRDEGATDSGHCEVHAYIAPNIGFGLRMPGRDWNGKLLMVGCAGWCGDYQWSLEVCRAWLRRGYACVATDMGHKSTVFDAKWAYNNLQAEVDFAFRATHVVVLAGKAIVGNFTGAPPTYSYFMGCSQGGRQALKAAQNFPDDFDGIIAGAPALGGISGLLWPSRSVTGMDGQSILERADVEVLHAAVLDRCDMDDNVRDGIIGDPPKCSFDPAELRCDERNAGGCLSETEIAAATKIYDGPRDSSGRPPRIGGLQKGSELNWVSDTIGRFVDPTSNLPEFPLSDVYRYLAFTPDAGPSWQPSDFDFDRDPRRMAMFEALNDARNPDLRAFKASGGKLILFHGWNDTSLPPLPTIDYYETVVRTMGGRSETDDFVRLFMVPGLNHCTGGEGAYAIDFMRPLEAWVEGRELPDVVLAAHPVAERPYSMLFHDLEPPLDPVAFSFTRPLFPYPKRAVYGGRGNPAHAGQFEAIAP